jgi:Zn finger protein HypA/HybF involved in hydrogenase expression
MAELKTRTQKTFHCMMCAHEWQDDYDKGEDKERSCPKCRSNSVRLMKKKRG